MRIHTDTLTYAHLWEAVQGLDGVYVDDTRRGSRSRDHAYDVTLTAEPRKGRRRRNSGNRGGAGEYGATWDEWGVFLAHLFDVDKAATCYAYGGYEDFHTKTGWRFDGHEFTPCDQHKWEFFAAREFECAKGCGAVKRY